MFVSGMWIQSLWYLLSVVFFLSYLSMLTLSIPLLELDCKPTSLSHGFCVRRSSYKISFVESLILFPASFLLDWLLWRNQLMWLVYLSIPYTCVFIRLSPWCRGYHVCCIVIANDESTGWAWDFYQGVVGAQVVSIILGVLS